MFRNRLFVSHLITGLLYLLVGSALLYTSKTLLVSAQKPKEQCLCMSLSAFVPEVKQIQAKQEQAKEEEPPQKIVENEKITPVPTPVQPIIESKPTPESIPIKKKLLAKPKVPTKTPKQKTVQKTVQKNTNSPKQMPQKASPLQQKSASAQQNQFLAAIREKINQHKSYPRIAKKRGMQGVVNVKFTILSSGKVAQITVSGPKIFHASAEHAVQGAFPIDAKNAPLSLPTTVSITLQYKFK